MSWDDDTIWRIRLDDISSRGGPLPIIKMTEKRVYVERWSGKALHPDGRVEHIGKRTVLAFDREELRQNRKVYRGRVRYSLDNPDDDPLVNPDAYCGPD